ncbi:unnamed protein product [Phytomonas sp. EM1]|nr:unnamed protein product [Phytomonas sp. EM1]|eukprot:CCW65091.1 unnamed protein product [Phytomonas sp. isolate EM1]
MDTPSSISVASSSSDSSVVHSGQSTSLLLAKTCELSGQPEGSYSKRDQAQPDLCTLVKKGLGLARSADCPGLSIQIPPDAPLPRYQMTAAFPTPAAVHSSASRECTDEVKGGYDNGIKKGDQKALDEEATVMDAIVERYRELQAEWYRWCLYGRQPPLLSPSLLQEKYASGEVEGEFSASDEEPFIAARSQYHPATVTPAHQARCDAHHGDQAQRFGRGEFPRTKDGKIRRFGRQWGIKGRRWLSRLFRHSAQIGSIDPDNDNDCMLSLRSSANFMSSAREGCPAQTSSLALSSTRNVPNSKRKPNSGDRDNHLIQTNPPFNSACVRTRRPNPSWVSFAEGEGDPQGHASRLSFSWVQHLAPLRSLVSAARSTGARRLEACRRSLTSRISVRSGEFKSTLPRLRSLSGRWRAGVVIGAAAPSVEVTSPLVSRRVRELIPSAWELPLPCASSTTTPSNGSLHQRTTGQALGDSSVHLQHPCPSSRVDIEGGGGSVDSRWGTINEVVPGVVQVHASREMNEGYQDIRRPNLKRDPDPVGSNFSSFHYHLKKDCVKGDEAINSEQPLSLSSGMAAHPAVAAESIVPSSPATFSSSTSSKELQEAFFRTMPPLGNSAHAGTSPRLDSSAGTTAAGSPDKSEVNAHQESYPLRRWTRLPESFEGQKQPLSDSLIKAATRTSRDAAIRRLYDEVMEEVCEEMVRHAVGKELSLIRGVAERALSEWILRNTLDCLSVIEEEQQSHPEGFRLRFSGVLDHIRSRVPVSLTALELNEEDKGVLARIGGRGHDQAIAIQPPRDESQAVVGFSPMTYAQLATLRPGVWLNDQVINNYFALVCWEVNQYEGVERVASLGTHFFAKVDSELSGLRRTASPPKERGGRSTDAATEPSLPHLPPNSPILRWLRRRSHLLLPYASRPVEGSKEGAESSAAPTTTVHTLLIPVNLSDQHWVLVVFRKDLDTWHYYDSMWAPRGAARGQRILRVLEHALAECRRHLCPAPPPPGVGGGDASARRASRYVVAQPYISPPPRSGAGDPGMFPTKRRRSRLDTLYPYGSLEALRASESEYKRRRRQLSEKNIQTAEVDDVPEALACAQSEAEQEEAVWFLGGFDLMPQQTNSDDCGVFVCAAAWCGAQSVAVSFEQDVRMLRDVIALELWSMKTLRRLPTADSSSSMDVSVFNSTL